MNPKAYHNFRIPVGPAGTCGMLIGIHLQKTAIERGFRKALEGRIDCENEEQMQAAMAEMMEGVLADVTFGLLMPQEGPRITAPPPGFDPGRNRE